MTVLEDLKRERAELAAKAALFDRLAKLFGKTPDELAQGLRDGTFPKGIEHIAAGYEDREAIYRAFPCVRCGKPLQWSSAWEFVEALQSAIRKGKWKWRHERGPSP